MIKNIKTIIRKNLENWGILPVRADFLNILPKHAEGAELGVFQGQFSKDLILKTQPQKIHLIDPWWTVIGEYYGDWSRYHNHGELLSTKRAYQQAQSSVASVDREKAAEFHVEDDVAVLKRMEDNSLDWAYVDSTHLYEHTVKELEELERIIKPEGIIAGHDWHPDPKHQHHGVYVAVQEFCKKHNWKIIKIDKKHTQWAIQRK